MRRQSFVVALDNDGASERGRMKACDDSADCPRCKDWNADLLASAARPQHLNGSWDFLLATTEISGQLPGSESLAGHQWRMHAVE